MVNPKVSEEQIQGRVLHYTTSDEITCERNSFGMGKIICEPFTLNKSGNDTDTKLFQYKKTKMVNCHDKVNDEIQIQHAYNRIFDRLNENLYDMEWNNCEHAATYIMTGTAESKQLGKNRKLANCLHWISYIKEIGFKTTVMMALVIAVVGSMVRYSYVELTVAATIVHDAGIGHQENCSETLGKNVILEAKSSIENGKTITADLSSLPGLDNAIQNLTKTLQNSIICDAARKLAYDAIWETCGYAFVIVMLVESLFIIGFIFFSIAPQYNKRLKVEQVEKKSIYGGKIFGLIFTAVFTNALAIGFGGLAQYYCSPPARWFIVVSFVSSIVLRIFLSIMSRFIFRRCCCFCCKCDNTNGRTFRFIFSALLFFTAGAVCFFVTMISD